MAYAVFAILVISLLRAIAGALNPKSRALLVVDCIGIVLMLSCMLWFGNALTR